MKYAIAPSVAKHSLNWCWTKDRFTYDELNKIIAIGDATPDEQGQVGDGSTQGAELADRRECRLAWLPIEEATAWLYQKVGDIVRELNAQYIGFDLSGIVEALQYTVYDASRGTEHYTWHMDSKGAGEIPRKVSFVLQLSKPTAYEGGEFWIRSPYGEMALQKEQGLIFVFPSFMEHRVTPVTKGLRRSLVCWVTGPELR